MYYWNLVEVLPGFWEFFKGSEGLPQHGIHVLMCNTKLVNNLELILLKYKRPKRNQLTNKLVIGHQPFDRLVANIQSEFSAIKIGLEMYDVPYSSKTLPLVWRIITFSLVASGCIGNNIFFVFFTKLAKNNTNTKNILVNV
jgi:hypothetical protein